MTWAIIHSGLPWLLSAITLYMTWLAGNLSRRAWGLGLLNQALWCLYTVAVWQVTGPLSALGLVPLNVGLTLVYYRNHRNWRKL